jgi:hypothetical protein
MERVDKESSFFLAFWILVRLLVFLAWLLAVACRLRTGFSLRAFL